MAETATAGSPSDPRSKSSKGPLGRWMALPLYIQILIMMVLGIIAGLSLGKNAAPLAVPSKALLQVLGAVAPPLILVAVMHVLLTTEIHGRQAMRMVWLLLLNTLVAIIIGLVVANTLQPGRHVKLDATQQETLKTLGPGDMLLHHLPRSLVGPLGDGGSVIGTILIALAFGIAGRVIPQRALLTSIVEMFYALLVKVLHWIIAVVPIAVFCVVARVVGEEGFAKLQSLGAFVLAVLVALALQTVWYLARIRVKTWVRPIDVLRGMRDALVMAFSTASSTSTMPVTYACLRHKVGLREKSASMGALVGANFNNDGTALYEAMAALFVAQSIGTHLSLAQQLVVILTSIVASVGAAGIPEAGIITMTAVFSAVGLPTNQILTLLTVDWFLDRCRTTVNVLGDVNVSCLLDGRKRETPEEASASVNTSVSAAVEASSLPPALLNH